LSRAAQLEATNQNFGVLELAVGEFRLLQHPSNDSLAFSLPLRSIVESVAQELIARNSKHVTFLELLGQWYLRDEDERQGSERATLRR
jgi:hypothetical protein